MGCAMREGDARGRRGGEESDWEGNGVAPLSGAYGWRRGLPATRTVGTGGCRRLAAADRDRRFTEYPKTGHRGFRSHAWEGRLKKGGRAPYVVVEGVGVSCRRAGKREPTADRGCCGSGPNPKKDRVISQNEQKKEIQPGNTGGGHLMS